MLAYVFWHRARSLSGYEAALVDFQGELARARLPYLLSAAAYRVRDVPWVPGGGVAYEDWYVVRDFADLAPLKTAATSGEVGLAHDRAAALAAWGTAGLYEVARGTPPLGDGPVTWLLKPAEVPYAEFLRALPETPLLVKRQLALGPTPELCAGGALEGGLVVGRELICPPL